jgi:ribosome maturation factor RimP
MPLSFVYRMIEKTVVKEVVDDALKGSDQYLVEVKVSSDNKITVEIDCDQGIAIDDCIALTKHIESRLDRDVEDYELEVGSAGIGQPFKIQRQYRKNIGKEVEVLTKNGKKLSGILKEAGDDILTLGVEKQVKPEGAKRKITVEEAMILSYSEIKYTKNIIRFK